MNNKIGYLNEERLGIVLKDLFPKANIIPQYKWDIRRKADYAIQMKVSDIPDSLSNKTSLDYVLHEFAEDDDNFDEDGEFINLAYDGPQFALIKIKIERNIWG
jgi:hypothetical protein